MKGSHRGHQSDSPILVAANFARDGTHALAAINDLHSLFEGKVQDFLTFDSLECDSFAGVAILSSSAASAGRAYDSVSDG